MCDLGNLFEFKAANEIRYLISLRGTNGSGKSYFVRKFVEAHSDGIEEIFVPRFQRQPVATFLPKVGTIVLGGNYLTKVSGGCDLIDPKVAYQLMNLLTLTNYHVLFEGVLISTIYSTSIYNALNFMATSVVPTNVVFMYLDRDVDSCLKNINDRNQRIGKKSIGSKNVAYKIPVIMRQHEKIERLKQFLKKDNNIQKIPFSTYKFNENQLDKGLPFKLLESLLTKKNF